MNQINSNYYSNYYSNNTHYLNILIFFFILNDWQFQMRLSTLSTTSIDNRLMPFEIHFSRCTYISENFFFGNCTFRMKPVPCANFNTLPLFNLAKSGKRCWRIDLKSNKNWTNAETLHSIQIIWDEWFYLLIQRLHFKPLNIQQQRFKWRTSHTNFR